MAVVDWVTTFKRKRIGLCSSWLASLNPKKGKVFVPIWFTKGAITLPSPAMPLILVGPGTGCAPFRAFIEEREAMAKTGEEVAPVLFFFGCRNQAKDFLFEEDWSAWSKDAGVLSGDLGGFIVAFSRDQQEKVYVQHKIREQVNSSSSCDWTFRYLGSCIKACNVLQSSTISVLMKVLGEKPCLSLHCNVRSVFYLPGLYCTGI